MTNTQSNYDDGTGATDSASDLLLRENRALKARIAELERLVACDSLTPLFNRRYFMNELERWCWRTHRYGGEYGLLFIDVDNLKAVNDRLGHAAGDTLLQGVAKALLGSIRRSDLAARIGGDEFAVLLDNIAEPALAGRAERIAKAVRKHRIFYEDQPIDTGVSIGFTALEPGVKAKDLLLRADKSMYEAKLEKLRGPSAKSA